ncbi:MAG: hypothetical protein KF724_05685 [Phycisphaeraceae bacterium]|nr:hypothetical protein [Phycisphaeraceae bacterium]
MSSSPKSHQAQAAERPLTTPEIIGSFICRGVIPLWIIAGAGFKLAERNPNLLPKPVKDVIRDMHMMVGPGSLEDFMHASLRGIIAVEFVLAAAMIMLPRASRLLSLAVMGLFMAILTTLIVTGQDKCGCFGAAGPSPRWMLAIDSGLFLLAAIFPVAHRGASGFGFAFSTLLGVALAFGLPEKDVKIEFGEPATPNQPASVAPPVSDSTSPTTGLTEVPTAPASGDGARTASPPVAAAPPWPDPPARPRGFYLPEFGKWVGQRLSAQPMMHLLERPLPDGLDEGKWHVVFYRVDCDHCQKVLNRHFAGPLETRTLLVTVPDSTGAPLPNRVTDAVRTSLMRGANGPDYVLTPPIILTIVNGVVVAACENADDEAALRATLDAS